MKESKLVRWEPVVAAVGFCLFVPQIVVPFVAIFVKPIDIWLQALNSKMLISIGGVFPVIGMMVAIIPMLISVHPFRLAIQGRFTVALKSLMAALWLISFSPIIVYVLYMVTRVNTAAGSPASIFPAFPPVFWAFIGVVAFAIYFSLSFKLCGEALTQQCRFLGRKGVANAH